MQLIFTHMLWIWILLSVHHNFFGSEGLQGTHIGALNPFSSKLMTLTLRGGLWTFLANLALCATCLSSGLTRCFGFGGHGSLQLDGEAGIFAAKENGVTAHDLMLLYNCGIAWAWKWAALGNGGQRWVAAAVWRHGATPRAARCLPPLVQ